MLFDVKNPIPGFENVKSFEISKLDDFFLKMTPKLCENDEKYDFSLTLVNPYAIRKEYDFVMPTSLQTLMQIGDDSELKVYCVVILNKSIEESRVNFLSPIVCNMKNKTVCQVVLSQNEYPRYGAAEKIGVLVNRSTFEVKSPILGFEDITKVEIIPIDPYLATMKAIEANGEHKGISFTLINPYILKKEYDFDVPTPYEVLLNLDDLSDLRVYNTLILNKTLEDSGVNFLAPIVCNAKNGTMAQVILDPKKYPNYFQAEKIGDLIELR